MKNKVLLLVIMGALVLALAPPAAVAAPLPLPEQAACIPKEVVKINDFQDQSNPEEHGYLGQRYIGGTAQDWGGVGQYFGNNDLRYCEQEDW